MSRMLLIPSAAFAVMLAAAPALAEEAHHPQAAANAAANSPSQNPSAQPCPGGMGMMGQGGMGMMGQGGMGMGMMGGKGMGMGMMGGGMGGAGGPGLERIEGHIAFLKAELKITDAQQPAWTAFADALRGHAKAMKAARDDMMKPGATGDVPTRIERHRKMQAGHAESIGAVKTALDPLYKSLTDEQKKTADELLGHLLSL